MKLQRQHPGLLGVGGGSVTRRMYPGFECIHHTWWMHLENDEVIGAAGREDWIRKIMDTIVTKSWMQVSQYTSMPERVTHLSPLYSTLIASMSCITIISHPRSK